MIEETEVDGRPATVAYVCTGPNGNFIPCDKDDATLIKVIFDDGEHVWLVGPAAEQGDETEEEEPTLDEDIGRFFKP